MRPLTTALQLKHQEARGQSGDGFRLRGGRVWGDVRGMSCFSSSWFRRLCSLCGWCFVVVAPCTVSAATARPNVLVLYSDDQRADTIAALGNGHIRTPHLDGLVRGGTAFTQAYCMGAMQGAVCVPSRAMLLSGRSLFRIKENFQGLDTWPEAFRRAGYATFITGKWHNGAPALRRIFPEGRAVFLGGMGWPYELPLQDVVAGELVNPRLSGEHSVKIFGDCAAEFIRGRAQAAPEQPWLCYVAFNLPHDPRVAPDEFRRRYTDATMPLPANFLPQHPLDIGSMTDRDERLERWPRTPEAVRRHLADYYASIEFVDAQVGRILEAVEQSGQHGRTLVVFAGDSGLAIGSHGLFGKQSIYEHSMRVPLIFHGPGVPARQTRDAFVYLHDVFPTLGALAGVNAPEGSEGANLMPVLADAKARVRDEVFLAYTKTQRSIRAGRWKLIRFPQINVTRLFDLETDAHETRDLADAPEQRARVTDLTKRLEAAQERFADRQPLTAATSQPAKFTPPQGERMEEMIRKNQVR